MKAHSCMSLAKMAVSHFLDKYLEITSRGTYLCMDLEQLPTNNDCKTKQIYSTISSIFNVVKENVKK